MTSINIKAPEQIILKPIISVFGVGGAGCNAVNNMLAANLQGAKFVVANTDAQSLEHSSCENRIQLGVATTKGLGAGAAPEVGSNAAEESAEEIKSYLENSNMVFITAGMGGGTGTGAAPVVAKIAKELGILTVGVVTKPFNFEGPYRMSTAEKGLEILQKSVDTLIVIPNQNLFRIANERTTFADAFKMADEVLHAGVRSITDLMIMPGLINLDFADIRTVMSEKGKAMMGTGEASGEDRAIQAAEAAIFNPLLDHNSMRGAKAVVINITGGHDMTLVEVDNAANRIRTEVGDSDANIIFGSTFNPDLNGIIRVSVVATGIDADKIMSTNPYFSTKASEKQSTLEDVLLNELLNGTEKNEKASKSHSQDQVLSEKREEDTAIAGEELANETQKQDSSTENYIHNPQTYHNNIPPQPIKRSFLSRLFGSNNEQPTFNRHLNQPYNSNVKEEKYAENTTSEFSEKVSEQKLKDDIQDIPAFLRKNNLHKYSDRE